VPGEFFFMATAGLGVSLAGFTGLIAAVDPNTESRPAVAAWRLENVVQFGFMLTVLGFGAIAFYAITEDPNFTTRISVLLRVYGPLFFGGGPHSQVRRGLTSRCESGGGSWYSHLRS
jgi:hypothetical protein